MSLLEHDPRLVGRRAGVAGYVELFARRVRGGELGPLPVIIGLVVIWSVFQGQNPNFLSAANLTNLMLQVAAVGTMSVGVFLVLLLGEVDLSIGSVSGVTAAVMAVLSVDRGWDPVLAIGAALVVGALLGGVHGFFFTRFGVPSFVVTLAGLIGWQGLQLRVLGDTGTVNLPESAITDLTATFLPTAVGWAVAVALVLVFVAAQIVNGRRRRAVGLPARPAIEVVARTAVVAVASALVVAVLDADRGVPLAVVIFVGFVVVFDLVTRHTRYGRHIYAVGGNAEAARRAGISVTWVRVSVFVLAATMAAAGGVLAASRLLAVNQGAGGSDVLLNAIAAAVIGGTSLFGGRGTAYSSLLGMLVIGSISNGLDLLGQSSSTKLMITGGVLLAAVTIDAVARRGRKASGRS